MTPRRTARNVALYTRVTPETYADVAAVADELNLSMAAVVDALICDAAGKVSAVSAAVRKAFKSLRDKG